MKCREMALFAMVCLVSEAAQAYAGFVIRVGDGTTPNFVAGTTGSIPVFLYADPGDGVGRTLDGFTLAFDFDSTNNPNKGLSPSFSAFNTQSNNAGSTFVGVPAAELDAAADNYDVLAGGFGPAVNLATREVGNPVLLYNLGFQIAADAAGGTYSVRFLNNAMQAGGPINDLSGTGISAMLINNLGSVPGQFTVTAVPEPSTLGILGLGVALIPVVRRRLKRGRSSATAK